MGILDGEEVSRRGLTGPALAVVEALISAPIAWRSPAHLAADAGLDQTAVFCALSDLEADDWICHWETDLDLTVTFTPIGAARLGVRLIEIGPDETPRWARPETPEPSPPTAKGIFRDYSTLCAVVGPTPAPDAALEADEEIDATRTDRKAGPVVGPHRFVGANLPWPGPKDWDAPCPFCRPEVKGPYCLYCDGVDADPVAAPKQRRTRARAAKRFAAARSSRRDRLKARLS